jgi:hypothetical protein
MDGGVGVHRADENLNLGVNALHLLGCGAANGEGSDTLTIKTLRQKSVYPKNTHFSTLTIFLAND